MLLCNIHWIYIYIYNIFTFAKETNSVRVYYLCVLIVKSGCLLQVALTNIRSGLSFNYVAFWSLHILPRLDRQLGKKLSIMVIGDCGSGKTTLVNNLLREEICELRKPINSYIPLHDYCIPICTPICVPSTSERAEPLPNGERWFVPLWLDVLELLSPGTTACFSKCIPRT